MMLILPTCAACSTPGCDKEHKLCFHYIVKLLIKVLLQGELVGEIHRIGIVEREEFLPAGSHITARVPVPLAMRLAPLATTPAHPRIAA